MANLSLKEEYTQYQKDKKQKELREAIELFESISLIAEKLDVNTISRIVDAMAGIENAVGPVLYKLPSLKAGLDKAEADLAALSSNPNAINPNKTGKLLTKAMAFYQGISEFLRDELPVLMRSRLFIQARDSKDMPVGHKLQPIFQQALSTNKLTGWFRRTFLGDLFRDNNITYINNEQLSAELADLTYTELESLTKVGKMPVVMSSQQIQQAALNTGLTTSQNNSANGNYPIDTPVRDTTTEPISAGAVANQTNNPDVVDFKKLLDKTGGVSNLIDFIYSQKIDKMQPEKAILALNAIANSNVPISNVVNANIP